MAVSNALLNNDPKMRRPNHLLFAAIVGFALFSPSAGVAQSVRGIVRDRTSQQPLPDALVALQPLGGDTASRLLRTVRTDQGGRFTISVSVPGTYQVLVRRVGMRPYTSAPFAANGSAEITQNVELEAFASSVGLALPEVAVRTVTPCRTTQVEAEQVATLWSLAREALVEVDVTDAGAMSNAAVIRYVRRLDPQSLEIQQEEMQTFDRNDVRNDQFFRSPSADSLSEVGYWVTAAGGTTEFFGLDAASLLSEAFVRDHCFRLARNDSLSLQRVGLTFEPIPQRKTVRSPPEILGTVWLSKSNYELQLLRFEWTRLPGGARSTNLGGEIEFGRVASGPVEVRRWTLRMPQDIIERQGSGDYVVRVQRLGIVEEGGLVLAPEDTTKVGTAVLTGVVRDGERRPLSGAVVRLLGTSVQTATDSLGRYRLTGIRSGPAIAVAEHDSYAGFGLRVGETRLLFDDGSSRNQNFAGIRPDSISKRLCVGRELPRSTVVRLVFLDSTTSQPLSGLSVVLRSTDGRDRAETTTDGSGAAMYCGLSPRTFAYEASRQGIATASGSIELSKVGAVARIIRTPP